MANKKRQRQRARKTANPYSPSPAENPYSAPAHVPGTSNDAPTPDQVVPGMGDDQGDGTPPGQFPNAGRNGTAMATLNKVALHCFGCGAEGWVGLDKIARIGEGGKQLTCQVCKSTDLDVLDRDPVVSARQLLAMQRQAIWPQSTPSPTYRECAECGQETSNTSGLCSKCRKSYEDEAEENERGSKESSLRTQRLAGLVTAVQTPEQGAQDGEAAFRAGQPRVVPYPDEDTPVGGGWAEYAKAWYRAWDKANLAAPVEASRRTAAQRCDNCGHTIKSNVPNERGWECPKCHQGSMQDTKESVRIVDHSHTFTSGFSSVHHQAYSEPPMGHLTSNPTADEIMAKVEAIPLPIKRLPPQQQAAAAQVVEAVMETNPGLALARAWRIAYKTVTGLES